ncbi:MAG: hypothetical protein V1874_08560 [Spirochaetota bacterium]
MIKWLTCAEAIFCGCGISPLVREVTSGICAIICNNAKYFALPWKVLDVDIVNESTVIFID